MSQQGPRRTFISYSRINKEFALKLALELRSSGFDIWLDQLDIPTGSRWDDEVEQALEECEIFMVILTPASSTSDNVKDEIGYAIDSGKRILPILLENANVPLRLRRFQYVDFTKKNFDEGVEGAKQLLQRLIDEPTIPRSDSFITNQAEAKATREAKQLAERQAEVEREAAEKPAQVQESRAEAQKSVKEEPMSKPAQTEQQAPRPAPSPVTQKMGAPVAPAKKKSRAPLILGILGVGALAVVAVVVVAVVMMSGGNIPTTGSADTNLSAADASATPAPVMIEAKPTNTQAPEPTTAAEQPTKPPEPTAVPTTPTPGIQKYFTEEFDGDLSSWSTMLVDSKRDSNQPVITKEQFDEVAYGPQGGSYVFDSKRRQTTIFTYYDAFGYDDVRVDMRVDSRNVNANHVRLFCRYSPDGGWYEFRIANNGLYGIYFAKPNTAGLITYRMIEDGASTNVKAGNAVNEYSIVCKGNDLELYINGELTKTGSDGLAILRTGKVGFSVSALDSLPVLVGVDWVKISEPK